ncbi:small nuclear ribonucleoprotein G-like [Marmota marmota marmota]|uniref:small nuclear ribonucleoprotein G-like n=1 Tax=Marmota marmota marmota TaxID=9994 RepID=UPI002093E817|nr:small nuclear ribonucleoprotein G-like [Marmota marmota marmota]
MDLHKLFKRENIRGLKIESGEMPTFRMWKEEELKEEANSEIAGKRKKLSGSRHVHGTLQGFHPFMSLLIDEHVEMATRGQQNNTGMVVMQGNGVIMFEALE